MSQKNDTDPASAPDVSMVVEEKAGEDQAGDLVSYLSSLNLTGGCKLVGIIRVSFLFLGKYNCSSIESSLLDNLKG